MAGKKSEEEVMREFMKKWDTQNSDGIITLDEFIEYFKDVSASIDRDDYFELMMKNAWKPQNPKDWIIRVSMRSSS